MKAFSSPIFALFLLLTMSSASAATVDEICKTFSQSSDPIDFNFCLTSFQADPRSRKADTQGLAVIAAKLAKTKAMHNRAMVKELLKSKDVSKIIKSILDTCVEVYGSSVDHYAEAIPYIKSRNYANANVQLSMALTDVVTCINSWEERSQISPMAKEDGDAEKLGHLALNVAALLH